MAEPSTFSDAHQPVRSISLPSRIHSPSVKLEAAFNRLKPFRTESSVNSGAHFGSETLHIGLLSLAELYNCVHELFRSPQTHHSLLRLQEGKLVEEALEGSVTLLDTCDRARQLLLTMREHVQALQSAFRRKAGLQSDAEQCIKSYLSFRKQLKRDIAKQLGWLKKMESKAYFSPVLMNPDQSLVTIVNVLREATGITVSIFRSLLLFLSTPESLIMRTGTFLSISKLLPFVSTSERGQKVMNEAHSLDVILCSARERGLDTEMGTVQKRLKSLNGSLQSLESGLESMFKCLVQHRVSFLNVLACH